MTSKTLIWAAACLVAFVATAGTITAGLRRVFETGNPSAGNDHYLIATILGGVLFIALAGLEHHDTTAADETAETTDGN